MTLDPEGWHDDKTELDVQRQEINRINLELVNLINERAEVALRIGQIKLDSGLPIYVGSREEEVLESVVQANGGGLVPDSEIRNIFEAIMRSSRAVQRRLHEESLAVTNAEPEED